MALPNGSKYVINLLLCTDHLICVCPGPNHCQIQIWVIIDVRIGVAKLAFFSMSASRYRQSLKSTVKSGLLLSDMQTWYVYCLLCFRMQCRPWWLSWVCVRLVIRKLRVRPPPSRQHSFIEMDHEIFSTVILSLPLIQEWALSVSGEKMCTILVNRLED